MARLLSERSAFFPSNPIFASDNPSSTSSGPNPASMEGAKVKRGGRISTCGFSFGAVFVEKSLVGKTMISLAAFMLVCKCRPQSVRVSSCERQSLQTPDCDPWPRYSATQPLEFLHLCFLLVKFVLLSSFFRCNGPKCLKRHWIELFVETARYRCKFAPRKPDCARQ